MKKNYLTTEEVASLLKLKEYTVREYFNSGKIKAKKLNSQWRTTKADVEAYFNNNTKKVKKNETN